MYSRQEVSTKQSIVTLFLDRFTLTSEEAEAIHSREHHQLNSLIDRERCERRLE